jgi:hypothetical protein
LLIPTRDISALVFVNLGRCQLMAGFDLSTNGRIWVSTEEWPVLGVQ